MSTRNTDQATRPAIADPAPDAAGRARSPVARGRARSVAEAGDPVFSLCARYLAAHEMEPTAPQSAMFRALGASGRDLLLIAPTGSGKTLAAALPLLSALHRARPATRQTRCVVLAPTRALVDQHAATLAQIARALAALDVPLDAPRDVPRETPALTVAARTGDTPARERAAHKRAPPDVLVVTPESLATLLATDAREGLSTVAFVLLDEVHQLCAHKRGALLAVTLAGLEAHVRARGGRRPRRVGLTATANPVEPIARWITGGSHGAQVLEPLPAEPPDLELLCAIREGEPFPPGGWSARRLLPVVAREIARTPGTTMVFVSSRPRAEAWTQALSDVLPSAMPVRCFHGSMSADERGLVAMALRRGELRAVVATSSLESGMDIPSADRVLFLGAPATITQAVQSAGRSGHRPDARARAAVACLDAPDLLLAIALRRCAARGELEPASLRRDDEDVLVQAILSLCATGPRAMEEIADTLRGTYPFASLEDETLARAVDDLCTGGDALSAYDASRRLTRADGALAFVDERARRRYLRAIGTILDDPAVEVARAGHVIGRIEGRFAEGLDVGDRFALAGSTWKILARTPERIEVRRDPSGQGPVARWSGARAARSEQVTDELARVHALLNAHAGRPEALSDALGVDLDAARALSSWARAQRAVSAIPTGERFVLECVSGRSSDTLVLFTFAGARANDAIARVAAERFRARTGRGCALVSSDEGLSLTLSRGRDFDPRDPADLRALFADEPLAPALARTLAGSSLARATFREVARVAQLTTPDARPGGASPGLLYDVLRRHAPDHLLLRALDRALWSLLDGERAAHTLRAFAMRPPELTVLARPSPMSVGILARGERPQDRVAPDALEGALARAAHALWLRTGASELP